MDTTQSITLIIAVAGFLLSLSSWIHTWVTQRKSLSMTVYEAYSYDNLAFFVASIENHSRLPISITQMTLIHEEITANCTMRPNFVFEHTRKIGNEVIERKTHYSMEMPININSLASISGYILFENLPRILATDAKRAEMLIGTNRGRRAKIQLELPEVFHDPHKKRTHL